MVDKEKQKQVRSHVVDREPSPVININIKKWKNWKTTSDHRRFSNKLEIMNNNIKGKFLNKSLSCLLKPDRKVCFFQTELTGLNIYYWKKIVKYFDFVKNFSDERKKSLPAVPRFVFREPPPFV